MATPVFCCGGECGPGHWVYVSASRDTTIKRTDLSSVRVNPSAANGRARASIITIAGNTAVARVYIYIASHPAADQLILGIRSNAGEHGGLAYKSSDGKYYAATDDGTTLTFGGTGATLSTGTWYRIDFKVVGSTTSWTVDAQVDGSALGQATATMGFAISAVHIACGVTGARTGTFDIYYDDMMLSVTAADYPLGAGYVKSYIPNADGTHNVAGANDFERTLTGTDITNATTDAYQLIDDRPLESAAGDFINGIAPANSTDYVEWQYEDSVESAAPRAVEAVIGLHTSSGAGTCNFQVTLREHAGGTTANIVNLTTAAQTALAWQYAQFATVPGTSDAWTLTKFNALRSRFLVSDASPDPYIDGAMLEAEWEEVAVTPEQKNWIRTGNVPGYRVLRQGPMIGRTW